MPCIHPSESPPLGWLVPCLNVADLGAALAFWEKLGFVRFGGDPGANWAMLRNGAVEIHLFQGHIERDVLNFRGGDLPTIRAALEERGLEPRDVEATSWEVIDPDGRPVFFDSSAGETAAYAAGQPLTIPIAGDLHAGSDPFPGNLTCCLACGDLAKTKAFYETLGFVPGGGEPEKGWSILVRRDHPAVFGRRMAATSLSLFQDMIPADTLNFRGGNVARIAEHLAAAGVDLRDGVVTSPDGGECLLITDPDERPVFFDTTPPERLYES